MKTKNYIYLDLILNLKDDEENYKRVQVYIKFNIIEKIMII